MAKILVAEDDTELAMIMDAFLTDQDHEVECVGSGQEAFSRMTHYSYDIVALDCNLPGIGGRDLVKAYRSAGGNTPVIMVSGKSSLLDKEAAFDAGVDDYMTKPFHLKELSLRVTALLRRPTAFRSDKLSYRDIVLDFNSHTVSTAHGQVALTPSEFSLLSLLVTHPGKLFSATNILSRLWPNDTEASPESIRVYVARIRKKLNRIGVESVIQTVHGGGYKADES